jgi:short-subunit dehydrogenase
MRVALLGATKGMGRALARPLAEQGHMVFLLGREPGDLTRSAPDLDARRVPIGLTACPTTGFAVCDLKRPNLENS